MNRFMAFVWTFLSSTAVALESHGCSTSDVPNSCHADLETEQWNLSSTVVRHSDLCTVSRVSHMSARLLETFIQRNEPVIFPAEPPNVNEKFVSMCTKQYLLDHYGSHNVVLSSSNAHSYEKSHTTLRHYIEHNMGPLSLNARADQTKYQFGDNYLPGWKAFLAHYIRPPFLDSATNGAISFGMGGDGSGVPFHKHGHVFAEVLHGEKRWLFYPPSLASPPQYDPNATSLWWYTVEYPKLANADRPLECVLKPGEIVYIPDDWWHATLNMGQSVFISTFV